MCRFGFRITIVMLQFVAIMHLILFASFHTWTLPNAVQGWLHKLQPCSGEDALVILNKYVKNAADLKIPVIQL